MGGGGKNKKNKRPKNQNNRSEKIESPHNDLKDKNLGDIKSENKSLHNKNNNKQQRQQQKKKKPQQKKQQQQQLLRQSQSQMDKSTSLQNMSNDDKWSVFILLVLYTLQGIPMGLCGSIPLLMKERGVTYEGLSLFSLVSFPFSLKLLWAPIVDSVYFKSYGRRKSWLIPIQLITWLALYYGSYYVEIWLGGRGSESLESSSAPAINVSGLTIFFFSLYFLMATQDIAVDGWALTMLSKDNVGYGTTCNTIGQALGVLLANQSFIALSDAGWCKRFLGYTNGETYTNLPAFMRFWSYVFLVVTLVVALFKLERKDEEGETPDGIIETYIQVKNIVQKRPVQILMFILLTCKMSFAAADSIFSYRLLDYGMPKADSAMLSPILMVISISLPALISNIKNPLDYFMKGVVFKIITSGLLWVAGQYAYRYYGNPTDHNSIVFFGFVFFVMSLHEIAGNLVFVSIMTFFNKVSDPSIGGTYMTFLNTLSNLGHKWPTSLALYMLPKVNSIACRSISTASFEGPQYCSQLKDSICTNAGGTCETVTDGYTVISVFCVVVGVLWYALFQSSVNKLQSIPLKDWLVKKEEATRV